MPSLGLGLALHKQQFINRIPKSDYYFSTSNITNDTLIASGSVGDKNIPIISYGSGDPNDKYLTGDAVLDLSAFGITYDKSYYVGNSEGKAENWDYPFPYFDVANPTYRTVNELNYRKIEAQRVGDLKQLYSKLHFENEVLQGMSELLIYDSAVVDEAGVLDYIGVIDEQKGSELLTDISNGSLFPFEIFTKTSNNSFAGTNESGGFGLCQSNEIVIENSQKYVVAGTLTKISGNLESKIKFDRIELSATYSNIVEISEGNFEEILIANIDDNAFLNLYVNNDFDVEIEVTNLSVKKYYENYYKNEVVL